MRKYTKDFVVKDWNELTAKQQEEVKKIVWADSGLMNAYYDDERVLFEEYISDLKRKYKDLYSGIDLDWSVSSQGPYMNHSGWTVKLQEYPSEIVDLSDVGIDDEIEVTIYDVYPEFYAYVRPDVYDIYVKFDYANDLDIDYYDLEELFVKSANGKAFLKKWAEILSKPLEEYWEICEEYARGFQDAEEWLQFQMTDGFLRAVYFIDDNGNEVFDDFTWE